MNADFAYDHDTDWQKRAGDAEANLTRAESHLNDLLAFILTPTTTLAGILSYVERLEKTRGVT